MKTRYDTLDLKHQMMVDEYDCKLGVFETIKALVLKTLSKVLKDNSIKVTAIEARIKDKDSLIGKLIRKGQKYQTLQELTDIVGIRIITLYNDDVDKVASYLEKHFNIDWNNSIDKRKMHQMDSFGYNSLHYICSIPTELYKDPNIPELNTIGFEVQMRSTLQHAWAEMEHDLGYKSRIATPTEYRRMLGRLAGLMELADEEFSRIRISVAAYRRKMEALIQAGELSEVLLDEETFSRYIEQRPFDKLLNRIAAINQGEIQAMPMSPFLPLFKQAGMNTLQDVEDFIKDNEEDAYKFAMSQLAETDIDIIASTIAPQNLLIVATLKNGGGRAGIKHIFDLLNGESKHNEYLADMAYLQAKKLSFMSCK